MGYAREKYTREYVMKTDCKGARLPYGIAGIDEFYQGRLRGIDLSILSQVDFSGKRVLDIGFGRGEALKYALENGAVFAAGVDFSPASFEIAGQFLAENKLSADLSCDDARDWLRVYQGEPFDIILLLDVIEHIPREELKEILRDIYRHSTEKALCAVNTPLFEIDNDFFRDNTILVDDDSDHFPETQGMHCNRFTTDTLVAFFDDARFAAVSHHFFCKNFVRYDLAVGSPEVLGKAALQEYHFIKTWKTVFNYLNEIKSGNLDNLLFSHLNGFGMIIRREFSHVYVDGVFEPFTTDIFTANIRENSVVFDIGCHFGYFALAASQHVGAGRIYAFEPVYENRELIKANLLANGCDNIVVESQAVSFQGGFRQFFTSSSADCSGFGEHPHSPSVLSSQKETISLDTYILKNNIDPQSISVIKIDVEGYEQDVLSGMVNTLNANEDIRLILEFNEPCLFRSGSSPNAFLNFLDSLGFNIYFINEDKRCLLRIEKHSFLFWETFLDIGKCYTNLLCIRKSKDISLLCFLDYPHEKFDTTLDQLSRFMQKGGIAHVVSDLANPVVLEKLKQFPVSLYSSDPPSFDVVAFSKPRFIVDCSISSQRRNTGYANLLGAKYFDSNSDWDENTLSKIEAHIPDEKTDLMSDIGLALVRKNFENTILQKLSSIEKCTLFKTVQTIPYNANQRIELELRLKAAEQELERIVKTRSWRMTQPFRSALLKLKGLFRTAQTMAYPVKSSRCMTDCGEGHFVQTIPRQHSSILFIVPGFDFGGSMQVIFDVMRELDRFFDFHLIAVEGLESVQKKKFAHHAKTIVDLYREVELCKWQDFVTNFVKEKNISSVCVFSSYFAYELLSVIKKSKPNVQTICIVHGEDFSEQLNRLAIYYEKSIDFCVTVNEKIALKMTTDLGFSQSKIICIHNGINLDKFSPRPETLRTQHEKRVIWVGRFSPEKNPFDFIRIAEQFSGRDEFKFFMYGDGSLQPECMERSGCLPNCRVEGFVQDVASVMSNSYALVCTSRTEATPLVMLEALAMNIPVVTTSVGESESVIQQGINGCIVDIGNIEAFCNALLSIENVSREGIHSSLPAFFSSSQMASQYKKLFMRINGSE